MNSPLSAFLIIIFLTSFLACTFYVRTVRADGWGIYIRVDGSIDPPTAPITTTDNITYTLIGNITANLDGIVIERDNIVMNGAGYNITGGGNRIGITLANRSNVTVNNMNIIDFVVGIWLLDSSSGNTLSGNNATENANGIWLDYSSNNVLSGNNVGNNVEGIYLSSSSGNTLSGNTAVANSVAGIELSSSSNNSISGNNLTNSEFGIRLIRSSSNSVSGNNITANSLDGIYLYDSSNYNSIFSNNVTASKRKGILLYSDSGSYSSSNNSVFGNNITNNGEGIGLFSSSNSIVHNNFINNNIQFSSSDSANILDDGYSSGGNYWSNYNGTDIYSGVYQNETGSDGIGDAPYVIDANNTDRYPLMKPYVALLGDVNGDRKVNLKDVYAAVQAFNSFLGKPKWNSAADLDNSGRVDMRDIVIIVLNFNKHE